MGVCVSKQSKPNPYSGKETEVEEDHEDNRYEDSSHTHVSKSSLSPVIKDDEVSSGKKSPFFPFYSPSPAHFLKNSSSPAGGSGKSSPRRFFRRPLPPPSPAKHIRAVLARRQGRKKAAAAAIPEEGEEEESRDLDKRFGFSKEFTSRLEVGEEIGRGHFGFTCSARFKKGERKGQQVAVKVIPKAKV